MSLSENSVTLRRKIATTTAPSYHAVTHTAKEFILRALLHILTQVVPPHSELTRARGYEPQG